MSDKKEKLRKKVCIACGGSAGHIFPGLALAKELAGRYGEEVEISLITSENRLARSLLEKSGLSFRALPLQGLRRRTLPENLDFIASLFKGTFESVRVMLSDRPDCFVGFGSYVAGPPFAVASLLGIPTLIHEQNTVAGKANKIMRPFATKMALGFPEKGRCGKNVVFTGNPIRESASREHEKANALDSFGLDRDKFTILVIGGSQGSRAINSVATAAFKDMESNTRDRAQVIHISGERDYERVKMIYRDAAIKNKVHAFFEDMGSAYSAADISISRAGASVVCELAIHRLPSILIPYPFAGGHQVKNARFFEADNAAIAIEEGDLSAGALAREVETLINEPGLRKSMAKKMGELAVFDAGKRLADEVESLIGLGTKV